MLRAGRRSSCQLPILLSDLLRAVPNHGGRAALPPVAEFMHLAAPARWRRAHSLACAAGSSPTSGRAAVQDVRVIRGVGPVNAALLMAQDISTVSMLQQVYHHSLQSDKNELQRFLSEVVGFRNPHHCRAAAEHVDSLHWPGAVTAPCVKLAVEGNIGAGKSTFLDILTDGSLELQDILEVIPEPVDEWRSVPSGGKDPINLLDRFYKDPQRYAYTFQHYVLLTRMEKDRAARSSSKPLRVLERSIFSDRMVFVRAMYEAGYMGDLEMSVYDSWFSMEIAQDKQLTPDGFIYLKARPETCIKRLRGRNRSEEAGVSEAYLASLHDKHEAWLHFGARTLDEYVAEWQAEWTTQPVVQTVSSLRRNGAGLALSPHLAAASADGRTIRLDRPTLDLLSGAPATIRDSIVFLGQSAGQEAVHSPGEGSVLTALRGVPALVLDHEQNDILFDPDARQDYARKVKDFSDYVRSIGSGAARAGLEVQTGSHAAGDVLPARAHHGMAQLQMRSVMLDRC